MIISQTLNAGLQWYRATRSDYAYLQGEATQETLRRFSWAALFLVPLHTALAWLLNGYTAPKGHPEMQVWAADVMQLNAIAGLSMLIAAVLARKLSSGARESGSAVVLQVVTSAGYLVYGALSTAADLVAQVGVGPSTYMLASVMVGVVSLMRPAISVSLFVSAYIGFQVLISRLPIENLSRDGLNILAVSIALMAMMVSLMLWRQYARAFTLERELRQSNAALIQKQEELEFLAEHDTLTGLLNRRAFMRLAQQELDLAARAQLATHCIMVDLDYFKRINDTYGHPAGDAMLRHVANVLRRGVRSTDILARLGGEEFIVLLPHTSRDGALGVAEKMRLLLRSHALQHLGQDLPITASFGVSGSEAGQSTQADAVYSAADRALYLAKKGGRDRVEYLAPEP